VRERGIPDYSASELGIVAGSCDDDNKHSGSKEAVNLRKRATTTAPSSIRVPYVSFTTITSCDLQHYPSSFTFQILGEKG